MDPSSIVQKKAVIDWYEEDKGSIVPIENVPAESRHEGAYCRAIWDDEKEYAAKVFKISSDAQELEKADHDLDAIISERKQEIKKRLPKPRRMACVQPATEKEVAIALGEKRRGSVVVENQKKQVKKLQKSSKSNESKATRERDQRVSSIAKKRLTFSPDLQTPSAKPQCSSTSQNLQEKDGSESAPESSGDEDLINLSEERSGSSEIKVTEENTPFQQLMEYKNPYTVQFLKCLLENFENSVQDDAGEDLDGTEYAEPLTLSKDEMVVLREGYTLLISRTEKHKLLIQNKAAMQQKRQSSKLVKKTLVAVFGSRQLSLTSAKGTKNYKKIRNEHLLAIFAFVNKHASPTLSWNDFVADVNKKCVSLRVDSPKGKQDDNSTSDKSDTISSACGKEVVLYNHEKDEDETKESESSVSAPLNTPTKLSLHLPNNPGSATKVQVQVEVLSASPVKLNDIDSVLKMLDSEESGRNNATQSVSSLCPAPSVQPAFRQPSEWQSSSASEQHAYPYSSAQSGSHIPPPDYRFHQYSANNSGRMDHFQQPRPYLPHQSLNQHMGNPQHYPPPPPSPMYNQGPSRPYGEFYSQHPYNNNHMQHYQQY